MGLKIDLHLHTVYSDGYGSVEKILETAAQKGLDGLAITDHETLEGYYRAKECMIVSSAPGPYYPRFAWNSNYDVYSGLIVDAIKKAT